MIFFLIACVIHKSTLTGTVDYTGKDICTIELSNGNMITINSNFCIEAKEGDQVTFYIKKKKHN